jgi:7-carboxy-7-deazaguanine synthase
MRKKYHLTPEDLFLLNQGKLLPLMEEFYTIQGEGQNTGKPAYFVRIGGCDVGCSWCDVKESWNAHFHPPTSTDMILKNILENPSKSVVVTGGEPMMYNLDYFCKTMKLNGITTYLETSGSHTLSGEWDWICLSPKKNRKPLSEFFKKANELKVIVSGIADFEWAEQNAAKVHQNCVLYLQPEWSKVGNMMQTIVDYALENPKWKISIQSHKYMHIP